MTKNLKHKMMEVPFAAMTSMMLMTQAFAAEADTKPVNQVEAIVEVSPTNTATQLKLESSLKLKKHQHTLNLLMANTNTVKFSGAI